MQQYIQQLISNKVYITTRQRPAFADRSNAIFIQNPSLLIAIELKKSEMLMKSPPRNLNIFPISFL